VRVVLELHARCLVAFGTSPLRVVVMGVVIFRLFGNFYLANFRLCFLLGYFKA
jgi:hypothetical protein